MDHLDALMMLNTLYALLLAGVSLVLGLGTLVVVWFLPTADLGWLEFLSWLGLPLLAAAAIAGLAFAHWQAGQRVQWGGGRILQTVLAVPLFFFFPVGTAYAAYALWVCWLSAAADEFEEETREPLPSSEA